MRRGLSLRLRLALLSTALLGVTLLIFSLAVYFTLGQALANEVDQGLVDRAHVIIGSTTVNQRPGGLEVLLPDVNVISAGGAVVQVVDLSNGTIAARSEALGRLNLPLSREALASARSGQSRFELAQVAGVEVRLYDRPLLVSGQPIAMLQIARPIDPTEQALARLRLVLAIGTGGSLLLCILLGLLVARAALRPIDQLTQEAERIGQSQDFGRRVRTPATKANASDEVGRLAATFNGMLDRLQSAYGALQSANKRLEATLESQRRFVADASHELRTPLTTVRGNASLLRRFETLTPEDRVAVVDQIAGESERMSRLVSDLLTLARADAGQLIERKPVPLAPLLEGVAQQGRTLAAGKVAIRVASVMDASVVGDADALRQLLLILVDNAIKYTPAGGSVTLGMRVERERGMDVARISVVDTGVGIATDDLPHVFERFYRADRARGTGGTGLGLAIGKWIAEVHGGRIGAESSPGAGSIFTVTLPTVPTAHETREAKAGEPAAQPAAR